ncbi:MAG: hypothetical protein JJU21_10225 [Salinarimonas sp.]|nr:hypothetical protein [Salinarimonas sp.]
MTADTMSDELEQVDDTPAPGVTREHIECRVDEWRQRLHDLFSDVEIWARARGWRVDDSGRVPMHEQLMRQFDMPATDQPILRLEGEHGYALFKPKALWVIGANGRVDLFTSRGAFNIVDLAEAGEAPRWTVFGGNKSPNGASFSPTLLESLI